MDYAKWDALDVSSDEDGGGVIGVTREDGSSAIYSAADLRGDAPWRREAPDDAPPPVGPWTGSSRGFERAADADGAADEPEYSSDDSMTSAAAPASASDAGVQGIREDQHPMSWLTETCMRESISPPMARDFLYTQQGPPHDPEFQCACEWQGISVTSSYFKTKKLAKAAAAALLAAEWSARRRGVDGSAAAPAPPDAGGAAG